MTRFTLAIFAATLSASCLLAAPVPAGGAQKTTFPYPAKAPVVVCLNGYEKARDRLTKMLKTALPDDAAHLTKLFDDELNKFLEGRKLDSVRKDARAFLVLTDLSGLLENNVSPSVLIPVTSYDDFRDSFLKKDERKSYEKGKDGVNSIKTTVTGEETTVYMVDLKEYVALATDKAVAESYAAKFTPGSTEPMGQEAAESFLKSDLALYVNMDAINEQFGDQIRTFRGLIDLVINQAQQQGAIPGLNKKQLDSMKAGLKGMFQGIEDCRAVVVGGQFRSEGLYVQIQARFAENTASAKFIKSEASGTLKQFNKLPKGLSMYSESRLGSTLSKFLRDMNQEFSAAEDDDKGAELIEEQQKLLSDAGPRGEWSASTLSSTSITVSDYKDPAKAVKAITKMYKGIAAGGRINSVVLKSPAKVTEEAEKYNDFAFTEIKIPYDFEATVANLPDAAREASLEILKKTYSQRGTVWIGTDGKSVIQIAGKNWATVKETLGKYLEGKELIGSEQSFKGTREQLPEEASYITIVETGSSIMYVVDLLKTIAQAIPGGPDIDSIKPPKGEASFVGFTLALKGDTIGVTAFVPSAAMSTTRKMFSGILKNFE